MTVRPSIFLRLLKRFGGPDLRAQQFPEHLASRYRRVQLRSTIDQNRTFALFDTLFAPTMAYQAWDRGINIIVISWLVFALVHSWWAHFSWGQIYKSEGSASDLRRFELETFTSASVWALGIVFFYPIVDGEQRVAIAAIAVGALTLGAIGFARTASAAMGFLFVMTAGCTMVAIGSAIARGSYYDLLLGFLCVAAGLSVLVVVIERGKSDIEAFRDHEKLAEKSEVIDLLLKDYEAQATEWLWQTDGMGCFISVPEQVLSLLTHDQADLSARFMGDYVAARATPDSVDQVQRLRRCLRSQQEFHDITIGFYDHTKDCVRWILMRGRPQFAGGTFRGFRGIFADATVSVEAERQVQYLASYDTLTGLPNRNSMSRRLSELASKSHRVAALAIDLDGFKQINDSYGHHVGDCLLKGSSERLSDALPPGSFLARFGGDEFFALIPEREQSSHIMLAHLADQLLESLSRPFTVENFEVQLTASIGLAFFPEDSSTGEDLMVRADLALYEAKNKGRNRFEFFTAHMQASLNHRIAITERLKRAVAVGIIQPHYQSQHALSDGRLIGFEALARWIDEDLGFIGPDVFIPIAEQTGLIVELGEQLMRSACLDALNWVDMLGDAAPVVSVNISPVQFARTDITGMVTRVLAETGLPAHLLEIEVTEGVLISNKARIAAALRELSEQGVSIALDDFGTGYSSLSYLRELPLDRLKIDRSFVMDLDPIKPNPIVSTVIQLGHNLGLSVIAEGIEDQSHIETLRSLGCDDGQGYFYNRPAPKADVDAYVASLASPDEKAG